MLTKKIKKKTIIVRTHEKTVNEYMHKHVK